MPLLTPLTDDRFDPDLLEFCQFFKGPLGVIPNSVRTMARRPAIARAFTELNKAVMTSEHGVAAELKRLIGFITSANTGCRYCQAHTALGAQRFGASDERLADLWNFRDSEHFTAAEKCAFEFALAASSVPNAVTPEIAADLAAHFDEGEIVEILAVVALFGYLNRWNDSMATTLEDHAVAMAEHHLAPGGWSVGKHAS